MVIVRFMEWGGGGGGGGVHDFSEKGISQHCLLSLQYYGVLIFNIHRIAYNVKSGHAEIFGGDILSTIVSLHSIPSAECH